MLRTPLIALFLIGWLIIFVLLASQDIDGLEDDEIPHLLSLSPAAA